eukprot:SAG31_NODE_513_length_14715_cov_22.844554_8_plen_480_part_00
MVSPDGDLSRLLDQLATSSEEDDKLTHVFIETTGLGDPSVFSRLFAAPSRHTAAFVLRAVVAVVGGRASGKFTDCGRGQQQLAAADITVYNGAVGLHDEDSSAKAERAALQIRLKSLGCSLLWKEDGSLPSWSELNAALPAEGKAVKSTHETVDQDGSTLCAASPPPTLIGWSTPGLNLMSGSGSHDGSFTTAVIVEEGGVLWPQAVSWLRSMLQRQPHGALRIQGFLALNESNSLVSGHESTEAWLAGGSVVAVDGVAGRPLKWTQLSASDAANAASHDAQEEVSHSPGTAAKAEVLASLALTSAGREPNCCKIFVVAPAAARLREVDVATELRSCMVPDGRWVLAADLTLDFPACVRAAMTDTNFVGPCWTSISVPVDAGSEVVESNGCQLTGGTIADIADEVTVAIAPAAVGDLGLVGTREACPHIGSAADAEAAPCALNSRQRITQTSEFIELSCGCSVPLCAVRVVGSKVFVQF